MQISGEPFAQTFAGRNLAYYDRTYLPPNMYLDGLGTDAEDAHPRPVRLLHRRRELRVLEVLHEHGGRPEPAPASRWPMVRMYRRGTAAPRPGAKLVARAYDLLTTVGADVVRQRDPPRAGGQSAEHPRLPGAVAQPGAVSHLRPDDGPQQEPGAVVQLRRRLRRHPHRGLGGAAVRVRLQLAPPGRPRRRRSRRCSPPGPSGMAAWKESIWAIDFVGRLHDSASNPVDSGRARRRAARSASRATWSSANDPPGLSSGTYIGSTPLEGTWGVFMLDDVDNAAELLLTQADAPPMGTTLGGFATPRRRPGLRLHLAAPLVPFGAVAVTESADRSLSARQRATPSRTRRAPPPTTPRSSSATR